MQKPDNLKLDTYSEPTQTFKMERFAKLVKDLTIFPNRSILDLWQGYEYAHLSLHGFFQKQQFYKQREAEIGKKNQANAKQHPEAQVLPFENYKHY